MSKRRIVEETLKAMMDAKGRITPQEVVDAAKVKGSPLHEFFEWNVKKAAHLHWLETAGRLIRMVAYTDAEGERVIAAPFFVRDPDLAPAQQGYVSLARIRSDEESARDVLVAEMMLVAGVLRRARSVADVLGKAATVGAIEADVSRFLAEIKPAPEARPEA